MPVAPSFRKNGFTFRQFFVAHDQCGMKVSTDGIILGASTPLPDDGRVLDIGSGSGLISLMLAQRIAAQGIRPQIDAVEIEPSAVIQSRQNIAESPWPEAICVHHADILTWEPQITQSYAVIVSNPPFFSPGVSCRSSARQTARYTTTLTHLALLQSAQQHITPQGIFCVILPASEGQAFIQLAQHEGWRLRTRVHICEYADRQPHRVLAFFSLQSGICTEQQLIIRDPSAEYSAGYRQLTGDFYLSARSQPSSA